MSDQQLDYHVGLMLGYLLAQNAPTQILHALDVLLTDYRSKSGPLIGKAEISIEPPKEIPHLVKKEVRQNPAPKENKKFFWDKQDDEILERMWVQEGAPIKEISAIIGHTFSSVNSRIFSRGLKKKGTIWPPTIR